MHTYVHIPIPYVLRNYSETSYTEYGLQASEVSDRKGLMGRLSVYLSIGIFSAAGSAESYPNVLNAAMVALECSTSEACFTTLTFINRITK